MQGMAHYPLIRISLHNLIWISLTPQYGFLSLPDMDFSLPASASTHQSRLKSITPRAHIVNWNHIYVVHLHLISEKAGFFRRIWVKNQKIENLILEN